MKKLLTLMLAAVLVLSMASVAFAAPITSGSTANIVLEPGDLVVVDPPGPGQPDPDLPNILDRDMYFGTHKIDNVTKDYKAVDVATGLADEPVGVIVSDPRGGDGKWHVQVQITRFQDALVPGTETLAGFQLKLDAIGGSVAGTGVVGQEPVQASGLSIVKDIPQTLFTANATTGSAGKWGGNWGAKLNVLGGTEKAAKNVSTLTWTLAPGLI